MTRAYVAADWMNLEGRLTAYFSCDPVLTMALANELVGGPKVHSLNAGLIYGIKPEEAKEYKVNLKGNLRPAYDAGKRLTHAWNYGATPFKLAETFWISRKFASEIDARLRERYKGVVAWRTKVVDEVFGVAVYQCARCKMTRIRVGGNCPNCSRRGRPVVMGFKEYKDRPTGELRTPFGRRRIYLGKRKKSANAVISQLPQSCGASIWYRTLMRLHGYDPYTKGPWPVPEGADVLVLDPWTSLYTRVLAPCLTSVATGTYDSFVLETEERFIDEVLRWLLWTMEQPWRELGGTRFPAEGAVGANWGKLDKSCRTCGCDEHGALCLECRCTKYEPRNLHGLVEQKHITPLDSEVWHDGTRATASQSGEAGNRL